VKIILAPNDVKMIILYKSTNVKIFSSVNMKNKTDLILISNSQCYFFLSYSIILTLPQLGVKRIITNNFKKSPLFLWNGFFFHFPFTADVTEITKK
jgi:hypothetical protein